MGVMVRRQRPARSISTLPLARASAMVSHGGRWFRGRTHGLLFILAAFMLPAALWIFCSRGVLRGRPSARGLTIFFNYYTNAASGGREAVFEAQNGGKNAIVLVHAARVLYLGDVAKENLAFFKADDLSLQPGRDLRLRLPAPTNGLRWRIEVSCISQNEIDRLLRLRKWLPASELLKRWTAGFFVLHPRYALSGWTEPDQAAQQK